MRRLGTQVLGNILAVSISGAALLYSAVWTLMKSPSKNSLAVKASQDVPVLFCKKVNIYIDNLDTIQFPLQKYVFGFLHSFSFLFQFLQLPHFQILQFH